MTRSCLLLTVLAFTVSVVAQDKQPTDGPLKDELDRDYWLYLPAEIDPAKTYWLVVGCHGNKGNGRGAAGMQSWTKRGDCIVVGPTFPQGFQGLANDSAAQLIKLRDRIAKQYKIHPRMFLYGFSAGAQFAHRFTMYHPEQVFGCAAHSAGSWATGGQFMSIQPLAAGIPFAISCGEKDTALSVPDYPLGRFAWFEKFCADLKAAKFVVKAVPIPETGHSVSKTSTALTEECFRFALTGLCETEWTALQEQYAALAKLKPNSPEALAAAKELAATPFDNKTLAESGWHVTPEQRRFYFMTGIRRLVPAFNPPQVGKP